MTMFKNKIAQEKARLESANARADLITDTWLDKLKASKWSALFLILAATGLIIIISIIL